MGTVKISATELAQLKAETERQERNLEQVIQQIAAGVRNRDWKSAAAESFEARWMRDKATMEKLREALRAWAKELQMHKDVATETNRPFN